MMVLYKRDIKRKYRDGSASIESIPKRAKVHAQRKFAQGLSCNSVSDKSFIKEKGKVKPNGNTDPVPLLPANRPKTEDFLTYLCYRNTASLPSRLNFFDSATEVGHSPPGTSTSNQANNEVVKPKKETLRGKHSAVKIHPNKFKEKKPHTSASRMDVKRGSGRPGKMMRRQPVPVRRTPRSISRRPLNSAIHRRLGDKRMRAGLRSGGVLPAGSDAGLSSFRRPRSSSGQPLTYPVRKSAIPLGDSSDDEEEVEEDSDKEVDKEEISVTHEKQNIITRTRSNSLKSHPSPARSLKRLPTRKTKEAAAAYMEILNKSLRKSDIDSDSYDEAEDPARLEKVRRRGRVAVKEVSISKKVMPTKVLPGRSLKDKSLKRGTLITQRKLMKKNLRVKRVEEVSKRHTRSRAEPEELDNKQSKRTRASQSRVEREELEQQEEEHQEVEDEFLFSKSVKSSIVKKETNVNPLSERRSKRLIKEEEVTAMDQSSTIKDKDVKKPIRRSTALSPTVKSPQVTRVSRKSCTELKTNKKTQLVREATIRNSPSRIRMQEVKKDKPDVETSTVVSRRNSKKDVTDEIEDKSPIGTRQYFNKKDLNADNKESNSSPSRLRSQIKSNKREEKNESEIKVVTAVNKRLSRSSLRKEDKTEETSSAKQSPSRPVRNANTLEKNNSQDDNSKTKSNAGNSKKKGTEEKSKTSMSKDDKNVKDDEDKKISVSDEPVNKPRKNSRALVTNVKENVSKKKDLEKEELSVNPLQFEEKKTRRSNSKKSEEVSVSGPISDVQADKNGKPSSSKQSLVRIKHISELCSETNKSKVQVYQKNSEKTFDSSLEVAKEETTKCVTRKKASSCFSDEELSPKDAPKKKMKQSHNELSVASVASFSEPKSSVKEECSLPLKNKKDVKKNISEPVKAPLDKEKKFAQNNLILDASTVNPISKTALTAMNLLTGTREGSIDKLDEKDLLKGFDEVNAKDMEKKVDKFIEQMILKTSDDESKSKMRSKYKQTGVVKDVTKLKYTKGSKDITKATSNKQGNEVPTVKEESLKEGPKGKSDADIIKKETSSVECDSLETNKRGRKKSKLVTVEEDRSEFEGASKKYKEDDNLEKAQKSNKNETNQKSVNDKLETDLSEHDNQDKIKAANNSTDKKRKELGLSANLTENNPSKDGAKNIQRRKSSSDTNKSEAKVKTIDLETNSNCGNSRRGARCKSNPPIQDKGPGTKSLNVKVGSTGPKPLNVKGGSKEKTKKIEMSDPCDSSDSEDEPLSKRSAKLKRMKKKTSPPIKKQTKRGMRELKALDTSEVPLRTSRARVAKHAGSSFYYETDSSSNFSSSEEEISMVGTMKKSPSSKQPDAPVVKDSLPSPKEDMTTQTDETKDFPRDSQSVNCQLPSLVVPPSPFNNSPLIDEKKLLEMPVEYDFESEYDSSLLLMYPNYKLPKSNRDQELSPEDVRNIVKDIKANVKPVDQVPSTSSISVTSLAVQDSIDNSNRSLPQGIKVLSPENKFMTACEPNAMYNEARTSMDLLASVAEDIRMKNSPVLRPSLRVVPSSSISSPVVNTLITPPAISNLLPTNVNSLSVMDDKSPASGGNGSLVEENKPPTEESKVPEEEAKIPVDKKQSSEEENKVPSTTAVNVDAPKPKPKTSSIGETWIQAFKRAKIPKPGQLSPLSHSVKPFVRKPFLSQPFVSKQHSPLKSDTPDTKFKPFDRSSLVKPLSPTATSPIKQVIHPFKNTPNNSSSSQAKVTSQNKGKDMRSIPPPKVTLNIPTPRPSIEIKKESKADSISTKLILPKPQSSAHFGEALSFQPVEVKSEDLHSKSKLLTQPPKRLDTPKKVEIVKERENPGGKHQNLPLAVEHTLRRMSPVAVSRKPPTSSVLKPHIPSKDTKDSNNIDQSKSNRSSPSSSKSSWLWKSDKFLSDSVVTKVSDLDILTKKRVIMTSEEIEKWLDDSTSTGIEHSKDCGLFEKNQCECSFRTSGSSMQNSVAVLSDHSTKVGSCIVEPPMQLKDIEPKCTAETISTCKVEDYKEKLISQTPVGVSKENIAEERKEVALSKPMQPPTPGKQEKAWKSTRSMTEEEMCDFDFRFERNSNSPRESVSDMSSPTPKDEMSSSNDEGIGSQSEKKSIFHKNNRPLSKSPCAFNAENESSVYAFEPDSDLPFSQPLFRRKNKKAKDELEKSESTGVSVDLEEAPKGLEENSSQHATEASSSALSPNKDYELAETEAESGTKERVKNVAKKKKSDSGSKVVDCPLSPNSSVSRRSNARRGSSESVSEKRTRCEQRSTLNRSANQAAFTSHESVAASTSSKSSHSTFSSATPHMNIGSPRSKPPLQPLPSKCRKDSGFPQPGMPARLVEAPAFYPSEKEFSDPLEYLEKITPEAEHFGICRIVPPPSFKPECKVSDDMRFTSYNQYVHKMMKRWGPSVKEMEALRKFLATQDIVFTHPPWVGGIEIDLPRLYQTVQECGGLKEVMEKKRWTKVADCMRIPKLSQDRATKLDDIYCKYLLPYETLAPELREKWLEQAETEWIEKEKKFLSAAAASKSPPDCQDDFLFECITKGRSMPLSQFFRIARNTFGMWLGSDKSPPTERIEAEYWNHVTERNYHVCVNSGSIDCGTWGYGFPTAKNSTTAKHPWNLKVLTNHPHSVLRSLPPLMGVTVPTLHVGMLFSTFCWYRDPHGLPWIEYLHTGAKKVWYGVPDEWTNELRGAIKSVLPSIVRDSPVWLPSDTAMLSPQLLLDKGVSLCRTVQEPGQFIVIFPKAYTSAFCTGYLVSESVYYAPSSWLATAELLFKEVKDSCEPTMFSLEKLLFFIANDTRTSLDILQQVLPMIEAVIEREIDGRKALKSVGLENSSQLAKPAKRSSNSQPQEYECNTCNCSLFVSLVNQRKDEVSYCLTDALELLTKEPGQVEHCELLYIYDEEEMMELVEDIKARIEVKAQKKSSKKA